MLLKHDQSTLANMTAALDFTYGKLSADLDTIENREKIADAIMNAAAAGQREFATLCTVGLYILSELGKSTKRPRFRWFGLR